MSKINKIFILLLLLLIVGVTASGVFAYFNSHVDLGISDMQKKVFDLQVKLRNLTTGELLSNIRGWEEKKLQESFNKLSPPTISYVFGVDYLSAFLSSAGNVSFSDVPGANFVNIAFVGMSVKDGIAALTLNVQGSIQIWTFKYDGGQWKAQNVGYSVEDILISKDQVSFSLISAGQKKKYEFPIAVVPAQYAAQ